MTKAKKKDADKTKIIIARAAPRLVREVETWRSKQRPEVPTRSEAVRKLIEIGLGARPA